MKKILLLLISAIALLLVSITIQAENNLKATMLSVYNSFKELQPYLIDNEKFSATANNDAIRDLLQSLKTNFHGINSFDNRYSAQPGFASNLALVNETLDDVWKSFNDNRKEYSLWRLKAVNNSCVTCHTTYNVHLSFSDSVENLKNLDSFKKGEFYLASRQFVQAKDAFLAAAQDPKLKHLRLEALRKWLIIYTRVTPDPRQAIAELNAISAREKLSSYESQEVAEWIESLKRWTTEGPDRVDDLAKAENLVRQGLLSNDPIYTKIGTVELLRASSLLHKVLEQKDLEKSKRSRALYLLGLSYSKLPQFYINEMPEFFLEACIREYSGTNDAIKSYQLYKEIVTIGYTGSGGVRLPSDVIAKLQELNDIAYGRVQFRGRV